MINFEIFLFGLLLTSILTGLTTEGVKKILSDLNKSYRANVLAGVVATVLSGAIGISYIVVNNLSFTASTIVCLTAQVFMSWLCAMVGYDKVIQAIGQFKSTK